MKAICERLRADIVQKASNPYRIAFRPKDLKLNASDYGAFSDHCARGTTKSSKWCGCGLLKCVSKRPFKYVLTK